MKVHVRKLMRAALITKANWPRGNGNIRQLYLKLHINTCYMAQMDPKTAEKISKALADPTRLKILSEIKKKNDWLYCVDLYDSINLAQPSICHHLKQLTETAIILPEKEGRNIKYAMNNEVIDDYIGFLQGLKK
jgi:ArsR family transcriptional regulator, arsenate/arsenite/antimonite-responsive transcriptional repressor